MSLDRVEPLRFFFLNDTSLKIGHFVSLLTCVYKKIKETIWKTNRTFF